MKKPIVAVTITVVMLSGCSSTPTDPTQVANDYAGISCDHFRNVMSDEASGILSNSELRDKIKQVYGDSQGATAAGITSGAQAMLAAVTADDGTAFMAAATTFSGACDATGH